MVTTSMGEKKTPPLTSSLDRATKPIGRTRQAGLLAAGMAAVWMAVFWLCGPDTNALQSASGVVLAQVALHLVIYFVLVAAVCSAALWVAVARLGGPHRDFGAWRRRPAAAVGAALAVLLGLAVGLGVASLWIYWAQPLFLCLAGGCMVIVLVCTATSGVLVLRRLRESATLHTNRRASDARRRLVAIKVITLAVAAIVFLVTLLLFFLLTGPISPTPDVLFALQFVVNSLFVLFVALAVWLFRIPREDVVPSSGTPNPSLTPSDRTVIAEKAQWDQGAVPVG